jgi:hypothetical protein
MRKHVRVLGALSDTPQGSHGQRKKNAAVDNEAQITLRTRHEYLYIPVSRKKGEGVEETTELDTPIAHDTRSPPLLLLIDHRCYSP